jgi:hypothetical protein
LNRSNSTGKVSCLGNRILSNGLVNYNGKRTLDNEVTLNKKQEIIDMLRFKGSLEELGKIVARCEIPGEWPFHAKNNYHRFRASNGAILNWWPTTKALNFQGKEAEHFKDLFLRHTLVVKWNSPSRLFPVMNRCGLICQIPARLWGHEVPPVTKSIGRSLAYFDIRGCSWSCSRRPVFKPRPRYRVGIEQSGDDITLISRKPLAIN